MDQVKTYLAVMQSAMQTPEALATLVAISAWHRPQNGSVASSGADDKRGDWSDPSYDPDLEVIRRRIVAYEFPDGHSRRNLYQNQELSVSWLS